MSFVDKMKAAVGVKKKSTAVSEMRPTELDWFSKGIADVARLPTIPFVGMRFCYDMYHYSDLFKTIVRALVGETFRNGVTISRDFVVKCTVCGTEYQTHVSRCEICGSDNLRKADLSQYNRAKEWIEDVNLNDQSLIEVLKEIDEDLNIVDNAFLCVLKEYYFGKDGKLLGAKPIEVLRSPPDKTQFVMDKLGRFARTDDDKLVMFCLQHRTKYHVVEREKAKDVKCPECGKQMFPAYYRVWRGGVGREAVYYTNGEMLHIKKFTQGVGYGMPPVFAVWMKLMILLKQDFFIMTAYHLQRPPKGLLVLRGNRESIEKAWRRMMDEARTNPHMIYPLVVEPSKESKQVMEWLDLTLKSEDIDFVAFRDEVRRTVGCYDSETEILTEHGWKRFSELTDSDFVWEVNDGMSISLVKPKIIVSDYVGKMIHYHSKSLDLLVTPNHNMVMIPEEEFYGNEPKKMKIVKADNFRRGVIPQAITGWKGERIDKFVLKGFDSKHYRAGDVEIDGNTFCSFMGLWLSEGTVTKWNRQSKVYIAQSEDSKYLDDIKDLLNKLPFKWFRSGENFIINSKQLYDFLVQFGHSGEKYVPSIIKNATKEQIRLFLDWYVKGDGSKRIYKNPVGIERIKTKSKRMADDIQELYLKLGVSATVSESGSKYWEVSTRVTKNAGAKWYSRVRSENVAEVFYDGKIYCVEVPSHKIIVRRNGRAAICGNSLWGVMPVFTGESGSFGLANEGLQVVVTNRAVEMEQTLFNEKVLPWLCKALGFHDWTIQLVPSEARDIVGRLQREQLRIQNASAMINLGYKPVAYIGEDGVDFYYIEQETGEEIPKKQELEYRSPRMKRSARWMQRFEGEPSHGRTRENEQRFEGEETGVRRPKVEGEASKPIGTVGDVFERSAPDDFSWIGIPVANEETDVLKATWGKAVKSHFYGYDRYEAAAEGDYWEKYAGVTKRKSSRINGILLMNILNKNYRKDAIVQQIVDETGIDRDKAEIIVETEMANILNLARETAYKERTKVKKFRYSVGKDACDVCKEIARRTADGVSLDELKKIINEVAGEKARGYIAHPRCKCTFERARGEKAWWE